MGKHKSDVKKKKKESQLVIRLAKDERDAFVSLCDVLDTSAAREIRRFMREWVAAHGAAMQPEADGSAALDEPEVRTGPDTSTAAADAVVTESAEPAAAVDAATDAQPADKPKPKRRSAAK